MVGFNFFFSLSLSLYLALCVSLSPLPSLLEERRHWRRPSEAVRFCAPGLRSALGSHFPLGFHNYSLLDTKTFEDVLRGMQGEKDRKREKERGGGGGEGGVWRQGKKGPVRMSMWSCFKARINTRFWNYNLLSVALKTTDQCSRFSPMWGENWCLFLEGMSHSQQSSK